MGQQVSKSQEAVKNGCVPGKKKKEPEPEMTLQEKNEVFFIIGLLPFGNALDDRKREAIVGDVRRKKFEADEIVIKQGDVINEIFIITDGYANVYLEDDDKKMPQEVRTLGKGECFGAGLRPGQTSDATISASGDNLTLLTISRGACEKHGLIEKMQNEPIPEPKKKKSKKNEDPETPKSTTPSIGTKVKNALSNMLKSPSASRKNLHEEPSEPASPISHSPSTFGEEHEPVPVIMKAPEIKVDTSKTDLKVPEIVVDSPKSADEAAKTRNANLKVPVVEPMQVEIEVPVEVESPLVSPPVQKKEVKKEHAAPKEDPVLAAWNAKVSAQAVEVYSPKAKDQKKEEKRDDALNTLILGEEAKKSQSAADDEITAMIFGNYSSSTSIQDNPYLAISKTKHCVDEETPIFGAPCLKIAAIDTSCVDSAHRLGESGWNVSREGLANTNTSSAGLIPPSMNIPIVSDVLPPQISPLYPPELDIPRVETAEPTGPSTMLLPPSIPIPVVSNSIPVGEVYAMQMPDLEIPRVQPNTSSVVMSPPPFSSPRFHLQEPTRLISCPGSFQPRPMGANTMCPQDGAEENETEDVHTDAEGGVLTVNTTSFNHSGLGFSSPNLVQPQISQFQPTPRLYTGPSLLNGGYMSPRHNMTAPRLNLPRMISH